MPNAQISGDIVAFLVEATEDVFNTMVFMAIEAQPAVDAMGSWSRAPHRKV